MEQNYKNYVIKKIKKYDKSRIILTTHAQIQAEIRSISIDEIKENLINPKRLEFAGKQKSKKKNEEKFDCYFIYSNTQCHRYVIVVSKDLIVCTVIKINRRWQRSVERYAKI